MRGGRAARASRPFDAARRRRPKDPVAYEDLQGLAVHDPVEYEVFEELAGCDAVAYEDCEERAGHNPVA